jgi:hypothetical protein
MPEFTENPSDALGISESLTMQVSNYKPMFGSVEGADRYFSEQIYGQLWEVQSLTKKQQALMTATRNLNSLRFAGRKTDEGQPLEFPRNGGTEVPEAIQRATYEEALALLKGIEPDTEYAGAFVTSRVFGRQLRTDYDTRSIPEYVVAGIASHRAWILVKPLLDPARDVRLRRVS